LDVGKLLNQLIPKLEHRLREAHKHFRADLFLVFYYSDALKMTQ
jgi:hypothetical protein